MKAPPGMPIERIVATFQRRCRLELLRLSIKVFERVAREAEERTWKPESGNHP